MTNARKKTQKEEAARERKAAAARAQEEQEADAYWSSGARQQGRREAEAEKAAAAAQRKLERQRLEQNELEQLATNSKSKSSSQNHSKKAGTKPSKSKIADLDKIFKQIDQSANKTRSNVGSNDRSKEEPRLDCRSNERSNAKSDDRSRLDARSKDNLVQTQTDNNEYVASNIDDALELLSLEGSGGSAGAGTSAGSKVERHPERRFKAALTAFKSSRLASLKEERPGLRSSQYDEIMYREFQKHPDNPFNALHIAHNASSLDSKLARDQRRDTFKS